MIRILHVYPQMNNAGTERVIFNLYENIDTSKIQFDFLTEASGELDEKIRQMGGNVFYIQECSGFDYYKKLIAFFNNHSEYHVVHTHTHARMWIVLKAAKKCGVKCRIAHSHNARNDLPRVAALVKGILSVPIELYANYFFACSKNAAKWLFPHRRDCRIVYNGISLEDYLYREENRNKKRVELGIRKEEKVMIHVGRFARQKNHAFLLRILAEYHKIHCDWKMLLIGVGPLQDEVKRQAKALDIYDNLIFLNNRTDVLELLSAADVFVFPSLHEGLGIVVIEAQASGLPCIVSDAVPEEADMGLALMKTLSLSYSPDIWAKSVDAALLEPVNRYQYTHGILESKYNIKRIAKDIERFYLQQGES